MLLLQRLPQRQRRPQQPPGTRPLRLLAQLHWWSCRRQWGLRHQLQHERLHWAWQRWPSCGVHARGTFQAAVRTSGALWGWRQAMEAERRGSGGERRKSNGSVQCKFSGLNVCMYFTDPCWETLPGPSAVHAQHGCTHRAPREEEVHARALNFIWQAFIRFHSFYGTFEVVETNEFSFL